MATPKRNLSLALSMLAVVVGMLMLAYASVPLYRLFCNVTGYGGSTRQAVVAPDHVLNRTLTVRFNADVDPNLAWEFKPLQQQMKVRIGEKLLVHYMAKNLSNETIKGMATYNVTPFKAGPYFNKIQCFCFNEQTLKPGEEVSMPVLFFIDPVMANDPEMDKVDTITLSYTFFQVQPSQ